MLSLGYHKINFQVANSVAYDQLLQSVEEGVEIVKENEEHSTSMVPAAQQSKEQAFQVNIYQCLHRLSTVGPCFLLNLGPKSFLVIMFSYF